MKNLIWSFAALLIIACNPIDTATQQAMKAKQEQIAGEKASDGQLLTGLKVTETSSGVRNEINFKDGKRHGEAKAFYPNGKIWKLNNYKENALDGVARIYYRNGKVKRESHYTNDERDGKYTEYFKSGNPKFQVEHVMGKPKLGYFSKDYRGEEEPKPALSYTEDERRYSETGKRIKVIFEIDTEAVPARGEPVEFFLLPKGESWDELSADDVAKYKISRGPDYGQAYITIKLEKGQYAAIDDSLVAVFLFKNDVPVAIFRSIKLSYENF